MYCVLVFSILLTPKFVYSRSADLELKDDFDTEEIPEDCSCVPFYQCHSWSESDDEKDEPFNIRREQEKKSSPCTGYLDVCCKLKCGSRDNVIFSNYNRGHEIRIAGNREHASFGEFPWMLGILKGAVYKCGGSLIHPKVALTAAHCVQSPGQYTVRAGELHWEETEEPLPHQDRLVQHIRIHPSYDRSTLINDIALLIVQKPFLLMSNIGTICLSPIQNLYPRRCTVSGWGKSSFRKGTYQPLLRKLHLPLVPMKKCVEALRAFGLGPHFQLNESFLCAGGENKKDTCKGDGGSPLICPIYGQNNRYEQVGIVSWGLTCGLTNAPGVYVNVMLYSDWIDFELIQMHLNTNIYKYR